ncbi:hypothetical protein GOP47_0030231 [Adiantum capillus-veneris]|nr:hypothetical protein GOP47_0030231 [Adiantum capillus-veneris]
MSHSSVEHHIGNVAVDVALVAPPHGLFIPSSCGTAIDTLDDEEDLALPSPSTRETIAKEAAGLAKLHRRFSLCDISEKFEKGQAVAQATVEKISDDVMNREAALLDS